MAVWEAVKGQVVDDRLLREFEWVLQDAQEEMAERLVTGAGGETPPARE